MRAMLLSLFLLPAASADQAPLSAFVGGPSGTAVTTAIAPYVTFLDAPYGIGVDCPGNWSGAHIQFANGGTFGEGLGQHPPQSGVARVDFSIPAIEAHLGRRFDRFDATIGIDYTNVASSNGALFEVYLDGTRIYARSIAGYLSIPEPVSVSVAGGTTLSLRTTRTGDFNSNHACWGGAAIILGAPICPVDFNRDGFIDFFDYDDFVACFEGVRCPPSVTADFNNDAFVDFFDYDDFVAAFEAGC